ncbi:MAG: hypothetical protein KAR16_14010 [Bacteroidales bacterium]|nr:hypothetical protein [Bacteroidales bacterium]
MKRRNFFKGMGLAGLFTREAISKGTAMKDGTTFLPESCFFRTGSLGERAN